MYACKLYNNNPIQTFFDRLAIPAIVLYCATCINIRNVIIAMVTPVVIKSYDE